MTIRRRPNARRATRRAKGELKTMPLSVESVRAMMGLLRPTGGTGHDAGIGAMPRNVAARRQLPGDHADVKKAPAIVVDPALESAL